MIRARRFGVTLLGALAVMLGLLLGAAGPASAHTQIVSSTPANGERLDESPRQLVFVLSEPAEASTIQVSVAGPDGPFTALGTPTQSETGTNNRQTVTVPVTTRMTKGLYRVTFKSRSAVDGHTSSSEIVFGVQVDVVEAAVDTAPSLSALDSARTLAQGIALIAAGLAFGLALLSPLAGHRAERLAIGSAVVAGTASALGGLLWHEGNGLVVAAAGIIGATWLALLVRAKAQPRPWQLAAGLVLAIAPLALIGHAAVEGTLMTGISALHLVTTAAWTGTVIATAVLTRGSDDDRRALLHVASRVGGATFLVSIITGLLMANAIVPSIGGLVGSWYGRGLLTQAALVLPLLALAAYARWRLQRGRATSVRAEAAIMVGILSAAVFVAAMPPPQSARYQPTPSWTADTAAAALNADDVLVSVEIDPNTPGTRFLVVRVADTRRPAPAPVTAVVATVGADPAAPLAKIGDGSWALKLDVTSPGPREVQVQVTRPGMPVANASTVWTVAPTPGTLAGGSTLFAPVSFAIAGLLALTLLGILLEYALAGVDLAVVSRAGRRIRRPRHSPSENDDDTLAPELETTSH
jgi:copper transport protein